MLSRHLYAFPCGHAFHSDCLTAAVAPGLSGGARRRLGELLQAQARCAGAAELLRSGGSAALELLAPELHRLLPWAAAAGGGGVGAGGLHPLLASGASAPEVRSSFLARHSALQAELDAIVAGQCPECGDAVIDTIHLPLELPVGAEEDWDM